MKNRQAFTLIELLIVIAIIGILAVALLPTITGGPLKARDAARVSAVNQIVTALENVVLEGGAYPTQTALATTDCLNFSTATAGSPGATIRNALGTLPNVAEVSGATLCVDAVETNGTAEQFFYKSGITGANYMVAVQLEGDTADNGDSTIADAAAVRALGTESDILNATDGPADTAAPYFYIVVK